MGKALLYYLAQPWTAERHRQARHGAPARAAGGPATRGYPRGLRAVVARRLRTVLGGNP